jgi:hypothetical protein
MSKHSFGFSVRYGMSDRSEIYCGRFAAVQQVKVRRRAENHSIQPATRKKIFAKAMEQAEFDQWDKRDKV